MGILQLGISLIKTLLSGSLIAGKCVYYPYAANASTMEGLAMRDGLHFANSIGTNKVQAEFDSIQVIIFCKVQIQWWDSAAAIYADCVDTL